MGSGKKTARHSRDYMRGTTANYMLQSERETQPLVNEAQDSLRRLKDVDWMGLGRTVGASAADRSTQSLQAALAGRGGGGIGSALQMGAQGRVGAELGGLQMGSELQSKNLAQAQNMLAQALGLRWNTLTALLSGQASAEAAMIGGAYGLDRGMWNTMGGLAQGAGTAIGGIFGGPPGAAAGSAATGAVVEGST
jgi:hypothetical protein